MSKLFTLIAAGLVSAALAAPALACDYDGGREHHEFHDRDHHGFRGGIFLYDPGYAYFYGPAGYGYFCPPFNAYYPYVASCPVAWQLIPR